MAIAIIHIYAKMLFLTRKRSWVRCLEVKYFQISKNRSSLNMIHRAFKFFTLIGQYIIYVEKNQQLPKCHGFDSRASRNLDFPRKNAWGRFSNKLKKYFPLRQYSKISYGYCNYIYLRRNAIFYAQPVMGSMPGVEIVSNFEKSQLS